MFTYKMNFPISLVVVWYGFGYCVPLIAVLTYLAAVLKSTTWVLGIAAYGRMSGIKLRVLSLQDKYSTPELHLGPKIKFLSLILHLHFSDHARCLETSGNFVYLCQSN